MMRLLPGPPWEYSYVNSSEVFSEDLSIPVWNDGEHDGLMGNWPISVCRVDHAGEYGADRIYAGQLAVLANTPVGQDSSLCPDNCHYPQRQFHEILDFSPCIHCDKDCDVSRLCKQYITGTTCTNLISFTLGVAFVDSLLYSKPLAFLFVWQKWRLLYPFSGPTIKHMWEQVSWA